MAFYCTSIHVLVECYWNSPSDGSANNTITAQPLRAIKASKQLMPNTVLLLGLLGLLALPAGGGFPLVACVLSGSVLVIVIIVLREAIVQRQRNPGYTGTGSHLGANEKQPHAKWFTDHITTEYDATHQHTSHQQNSFLSMGGRASDVCRVRLQATRRCCFKHTMLHRVITSSPSSSTSSSSSSKPLSTSSSSSSSSSSWNCNSCWCK
jgi:hypothetical protein